LKALDTLKYIATLGPVGYVPGVPGTAGTAVAVVCVMLLKPTPPILFLLLLFVAVGGTVAAHFAEIAFNRKDPRQVVIDEFAGFLVTMNFVEINWWSVVLGFTFFRIFDILKPPPVRTLERYLAGGFGIMADDLMAGIYANISLHVCLYLTGIF